MLQAAFSRDAGGFPIGKSDPALSPDGSQVAFSWGGETSQNSDIYVDQLCSWPIVYCQGRRSPPFRLTTHPSADFGPAWSPGGRLVAFLRETAKGAEVYVVPAEGGAERKLGESELGRSRLAWSADEKFLAMVDQASAQEPSSIFALSISQKTRHRLTVPPLGTTGDDNPAFSPDGTRLAFSRALKDGRVDICLQPFVGETRPKGEPQCLGVALEGGPIEDLGWASDGASIIFTCEGLWRIPITGGTCARLANGRIKQLDVSRRAQRVVYSELAPPIELWRTAGPGAKPGEFPPARLLQSQDEDGSPNVSHDGSRITFSSTRSGIWEQWVCDSGGNNIRQLTFLGDAATGSARWSPDDRYIAFDGLKDGQYDLYVIESSGGNPRQLTSEPSREIKPSWSKDGQWIYFASNRCGDFQVYRMPFEGGAAEQITQGGGYTSFESPDGGYLYYSKGRRETSLWRVPVEGGKETPILEGVGPGKWIVTNLGICILNMEAKPRPAVEFYSFSTHKRTRLQVLPDDGKIWAGGTVLGAPPDGRWLVYPQEGQISSHLRVLEY
jgi:Tol biopolymer transport system component